MSLARNGQQRFLSIAAHCTREWTDVGGVRRRVKSANSLAHIKAQQTSLSKAHPSLLKEQQCHHDHTEPYSTQLISKTACTVV